MVCLPEAGLGQSITFGITEVLTASTISRPAKSIATARSQGSSIPAFSAAIMARTTFVTRPPARKCASILWVLISSPVFFALIRLSTMSDGFTFLRRIMMRSSKLTGAPLSQACNQSCTYCPMMSRKISPTTAMTASPIHAQGSIARKSVGLFIV